MKKESVKLLALPYYSRKEVLDAMFNFSQNREISPRYYEGFGKRPDSFQYPSDILALVKRGATSFHCSEEIWKDPLEIKTGMAEEELNSLRIGWDLIIDIDCKWIYYSKKAAIAIIQALESRGVKNIGIKFSGGKGFHIIIPWHSFPDEIDGTKTSDMFPEWPRAVIAFIKEISRPRLAELIKDTEADFKDIKGFTGIKCENCNNLAEKRFQITVRCNDCSPPHIETFFSSNEDYKKKKCPIHIKKEMEESAKNPFFYCSRCELDSISSPKNFNEKTLATDVFKVLGLDVLLVSPRHLFRMPYSLHEKTALASIVLDKNKIEDFEITDADPLNVEVKNFLPEKSEESKGEAKQILIASIDWVKSNQKEEKINYNEQGFAIISSNAKGDRKDFKPLELGKIDEEIFPPTMKKILNGVADGKKRALFILLNFFRSLGLPMEDVDKRIRKWNEKNTPPLKEGYLKSQFIWHSKHSPVMPPNFDNDIYKEIGVYEMDSLSEKVKNPVTYVARRHHFNKKQFTKKTIKKIPKKKTKKKSLKKEIIAEAEYTSETNTK